MSRRANPALLRAVRTELAARADPERALGAQAYMKSAMPFLGVGAVGVRAAARAAFARVPLPDAPAWRAAILELYRTARFREERYVAIELLKTPRDRSWLDAKALPVLAELIATGSWWDLVDAVATRPLGELLARAPQPVEAALRAWARGDDLWLRRAAILAQLHFRERTDTSLLERLIAPSLGRRDFFLAKAIGWALRQYARTDPGWVRAYVESHRDRLAPLSIREATRHLVGARSRPLRRRRARPA